MAALLRAALTSGLCWLAAGAVTASARITLPLDTAPQIVITEPAEQALGQPELRVRASCVDDGGTCTLRVGTEFGRWLAAGEGSIDAVTRPPDGAASTFSRHRFDEQHQRAVPERVRA